MKNKYSCNVLLTVDYNSQFSNMILQNIKVPTYCIGYNSGNWKWYFYFLGIEMMVKNTDSFCIIKIYFFTFLKNIRIWKKNLYVLSPKQLNLHACHAINFRIFHWKFDIISYIVIVIVWSRTVVFIRVTTRYKNRLRI